MKGRLYLLLSVFLFFQCHAQILSTMQQPEKKASLLQFTKGLEEAKGQLIFERYKKTYSGNKAAIKLYDTGDLYTLHTTKIVGLDDESTRWKPAYQLTKDEMDRFYDIFESQVKAYIANPSQTIKEKPISASDWYFMMDKEYYAYSQNQRWRFSPRWVRKMNRLIER